MENGIPDSFTRLPETVIDQKEVDDEQKAIKYLKSTEWKMIKDHLEGRKDFHRRHLPNGVGVNETPLTEAEIGRRWMVADGIITEIDAIINSFEVKGNG